MRWRAVAMYLSERALYGTGDEVGRSGDAMIYHALRGSPILAAASSLTRTRHESSASA
jgi:hypothetical protein